MHRKRARPLRNPPVCDVIWRLRACHQRQCQASNAKQKTSFHISPLFNFLNQTPALGWSCAACEHTGYAALILFNELELRWSLGWVSALDCQGRTIWIVDAHRDDGRRFIVRADEILGAFVELERQVLTVTFYLESINDGN